MLSFDPVPEAVADVILHKETLHRQNDSDDVVLSLSFLLGDRTGGGVPTAADEGEEIPDAVPSHGGGADREALNPEGSAEGATEAAVPRPLTGGAALEGIAAALVAALNGEQRLAVQR